MASESIDPAIAFLSNSGKEFDVIVLARSTEKALQIITPWCQMKNASLSVVCQEMQTQALVYATAIDFSVKAAHDGFAVCEDALALVDCIQTTTAEERREFLEGMKEITKNGLKNAEEAKNRFVHVRGTVETLLTRMRIDDQRAKIEYDTGFHFIRMPLSEIREQLTKGIQDLEEFSSILTQFVAWWNELAMETNTQLSREEAMVKWNFDKFHMRALESKWKNHRSRYAAYVNEINIVEDKYPKLFKPTTSSDTQQPEAVNSPPAYTYDIPRSTSPEPWDRDVRRGNVPLQNAAPRPEQAPHTGHDYARHLPAFLHRPHVAHSSNVIIDEHLSATSYMSATLACVQVLEHNLCFIMLQFQCHPSENRRFNSLRIKWRLKTVHGTHPAKMIDIAPKFAVGARNEENHKFGLGFKVPAQFNMAGVNAGPELNGNWEMNKKIGHAMYVTGSLRGRGPDAAEWTIEENHSAMTGIPAHFCVAAVVHYEGFLMMELDVLAKQRGTGAWWSSRNQAKQEFPLDVHEASKSFAPYKPAGQWREWFPLFNGEVGAVDLRHEALARN